MKILQIVQSVSNPSAGPSYSVTRLATELQDLGDEVSIKAIGPVTSTLASRAGIDSRSDFFSRLLGFSPGILGDIRTAAQGPAILHGHGIWRPLNLFPLSLASNLPSRIVWSPRGMLSEWAMHSKRIAKWPFWHTLQKPALGRVHCFHATGAGEVEDIRRAGLSAPVALVPNGIDLPVRAALPERRKTLLYLGRIDRKKGIDLLLAAWVGLQDRFPDWTLEVAGEMQGAYAEGLRRQAVELRLERVRFIGPVTGDAKSALYRSVALFVLPTHSENFGMVVAEALIHETPVITTTGTPWSGLERKACGWYVEPRREELTVALARAMSLPEEARRRMGTIGREWMEGSFSWRPIAGQFRDVYAWLLGKSTKPDCVVSD